MRPCGLSPENEVSEIMAFLRSVDEAARIYAPARFAAWLTLALMVLTLLYALRISVDNWSFIGV